MTGPLRYLRRGLDGLYDLCGVLAACFLVAILVIILLQILARWFGMTFPGSNQYAGYCMAAASFLALAHALNRGAHIRVSLLLSKLEGRTRRVAELWCLVISGGLAWYFAWYAIKGVQISRMINDVSQGQDATPLWIPQLSMAIGTVIFAIALTDHLVRIAFGGEAKVGENLEIEARGE